MTVVMDFVVVTIVFVFILTLVLALSIRTVQAYELGVVTIFGSYRRTVGPGFHVVSPIMRILRVDMRRRPVRISGFSLASPWGSVSLAPELTVQVTDAVKSVFVTQDLDGELRAIAKTTAIEVFSRAPISAKPPALMPWASSEIQAQLEAPFARFGVRVERVDLNPP